MLIRTIDEMRALTGNFPRNNDFKKIAPLIEEQCDELARLVSREVMNKIESYYDSEDDRQQRLLKFAQKPVAIMAALKLYQLNDISHGDDGRKIIITKDSSDKIPWQWQLDRDDEMQLQRYYNALDKFLELLISEDVAEFKETELYKMRQSLLIKSGREFSKYYPIDNSEHIYIMLVPFIREVQLRSIRPLFGKDWEEFLTSDTSSDIYFSTCMAVALLTMSIALRRLPLSVFPVGVVKKYMTDNGMNSSKVPSLKEVDTLRGWLEEDASQWISDIRNNRNPSEQEYVVFPKNDPRNKYFRL